MLPKILTFPKMPNYKGNLSGTCTGCLTLRAVWERAVKDPFARLLPNDCHGLEVAVLAGGPPQGSAFLTAAGGFLDSPLGAGVAEEGSASMRSSKAACCCKRSFLAGYKHFTGPTNHLFQKGKTGA